MFKLALENAEEPEVKLPTSVGSSISKRDPEKIYFCFIDYANAFDCVDHNKLWKALQENQRYQGNFSCRMGTIKDRSGMDLTEEEDIKKMWQEHREEQHKQS